MSTALRRTIAGVIATLLASLALVPAYRTQEWLGSAILVILFVAATGLGLRQLGTPRLLVPLGQLAALGWAFILLFARHDLRFGFLPSADSVQAFAGRINEGLLVVVRFAAPVPYDVDLVMVTTLGIGLVAIAVDALCATFRLTPWAGLPLLLLYSIPATTVSGGISALAFIPAAIGYVLLLVSESRERLHRWGRVIGIADDVAGAQDAVQTSLLGQTGRRVGATVIGLAVIVPALLPALPTGIFASGDGPGFGGGGQTIKVNNPIVDLKRDLQLPQNVPVMSYMTNTDTPDYIKIVTLDEFDGDSWKPSPRQVRNIDNGPGDSSKLPDPPGLNPAVSRTKVRTTFEITDALESRWLPTPYPPSVLNAPGDWGYDPDTLDIVSRGKNSAGLAYGVTSLRVAVKPAGLESAVNAPQSIFSKYTELPPSLPRQVVQVAKRETARAKTSYDKAVALQSWFRNDFTYDIRVAPGHGGPAMLEFLADRRGYCEQFAATMAIMARALGIPARVAVGYMPGTRQPDNRWVVTAHDSHAWPELYFSGYGWVRFEPTPQAQTGTAPPWTVPDSATPLSPSPDVDNPENPRQNPRASASATPLPNEHGQTGPGANAGGASGLNPLPFLIGAAVLFVLAVPFLVRTSVRRSRLSVRQPPGRLVERAWNELADLAVDFGLTWDNAATPRAMGTRLRRRVGQKAAPALNRLVLAVERSRYAPGPSDVTGVRAAVRDVGRAVRAGASPRERAIGWLVAPSLWRRLPLLWRPVTRALDAIDGLGGRLARQVRQPLRRRTPTPG